MNNKHRIVTEWNPDEATYVRKKLIEYNTAKVRVSELENVSLVLKDDQDQILGGITGKIYWDVLGIDILWVDDKLRGQGYGSMLLQMAEQQAIVKNCKLIKLDTYSFQAPEFYRKMGFQIYGTLENEPEGFTHYYLYKRL